MMRSSYHLKIGAPVFCRDKKIGRLRRVVTNPETNRVTDLVVQIGLLLPTERLVPVTAVEGAKEDKIRLAFDSEHLEDFAEYHPEKKQSALEYPSRSDQMVGPLKVHATRYGLPLTRGIVPRIRHTIPVESDLDQVLVERGTQVESLHKTIGRVDHLLVERESQKITHLVVNQGLFGRSIVIPANLVEDIAPDRILVMADEDELEQLPGYVPRDSAQILTELQSRLLEASFDLMAVKATILSNGMVQLTGVVPDEKAKQKAAQIAWEVDGVLEVANLLETDSIIEMRVRNALADDQRVRSIEDIRVISRQGLVTLEGEIADPEQRTAAEEIAVRQPGVFTVANALETEPSPVDESLFWPEERG